MTIFFVGAAGRAVMNPRPGTEATYQVAILYKYGGYFPGDAERLYRVSKARKRVATIYACIALLFVAPAAFLSAAAHGDSRMTWLIGCITAVVTASAALNVDRFCQQRDVNSATYLLAQIVEPIDRAAG
jgi:hypothetical protein